MPSFGKLYYQRIIRIRGGSIFLIFPDFSWVSLTNEFESPTKTNYKKLNFPTET